MSRILSNADPGLEFPDVEQALREPDGLLAVGGDLSVERLLLAYRRGIFPWFSHDDPLLWWSPDPRSVLFPERLRVARSLRKTLRHRPFEVSFNQDFSAVIRACAAPRAQQDGTWITAQMIEAYQALHHLGYAQSVEVWRQGELAGGLYGITLGRVFFGESMFTRVRDASKVGFVHWTRHLQAHGFALIDCQIQSAHMDSLGAENIPRRDFTRLLDQYCESVPLHATRLPPDRVF